MQAVLNISPNDIDDRLLSVIRDLLTNNVEITLKKAGIVIEEFDSSRSLDEVMAEFEKEGYSEAFLNDLREGLATSIAYER